MYHVNLGMDRMGMRFGIMNSRNHYMVQWYINILHHVHIIKHC